MKLLGMRKLSPAARQERRMQVIKLRNQGWTYEDIARQLGLSRTGVFDKDRIEVFCLPSYSPELNPNELLNANLKAAITTKAPARRKGQLQEAAIGHLRHLQKSPKKVQQFLGKDSVKYAA